MTALGLIENRQAYDTRRKHNDFLKDTWIVTSDYPKLVKDAIIKNSYAEMAHIYAISVSLGMGIHSYYPPQLNPILSAVCNVCLLNIHCLIL